MSRLRKTASAGTALALLVLTLAGASRAQGQNPAATLGSPLAGLALPRTGTPKHEGSWDRSGGNGDMRPVRPGETLTLLDYKGAGIIRRFWVTIAPRAHKEIHQYAILRMYWDGEETPSVEVPIGAFFGVGFGEQKDYISLPLNETSGGYNCYWPMPFHRSARWTLTNLSSTRIGAFYYNIDFTAYDRLPRDLRHFHAQYRRENPTRPRQNYTILEATGQGHFVGTALFMQGRNLGFLEGDEMIYVDGEEKPSIIGTGTEDYFSSGWYYDRGLYSAPYHGIVIKDEGGGQARVSTYRWHIEDAMPFRKSMRVTIEHGHANEAQADYSSVAYWYQSEPHAPFPRHPDLTTQHQPPPPMRLQGALEGESLVGAAKASAGAVEVQSMADFDGQWSGGSQLWWHATKAGDALTLTLPAPAQGEYELVGYFTKAPDYATISVSGGNQANATRIDLFDPRVEPTGPISLGRYPVSGPNLRLEMKVDGKDARSTGYLVGIDAFVLKRVE